MSITFTYDKGIPAGSEDGDYGYLGEESNPAYISTGPLTQIPAAFQPIVDAASAMVAPPPTTSPVARLDAVSKYVQPAFLVFIAMSKEQDFVVRLIALGLAARAALAPGGVLNR